MTVLTVFTACEKEEVAPIQQADRQTEWLSAETLVSHFTEEELALVENPPESDPDLSDGRKITIPILIQLGVQLSYTPAMRNQNEGEGEIDFCITGTGEWLCVCPMTYFEAQFKPGPNGYWEGEGWMQKGNGQSLIYFRSQEGFSYLPDPDPSLEKFGMLRIVGGTDEFLGASGKAVRKLIITSDDYTQGVCVVYGHLVLPDNRTVEAVEGQ